MGNSHSNPHHPPQWQPRTIRKQRSAYFPTELKPRLEDSSHSVYSGGEGVNSRNRAGHRVTRDDIYLASTEFAPPSYPLPTSISLLAYSSPRDHISELCSTAYLRFLEEFPEYRLTWTLDTLRRTDYARLQKTGETYLDYMGGSLYPESLIRIHSDFLAEQVLGNTHSVSSSSRLSLKFAEEARQTVLAFFQAPPDYVVIFTSNASNALKLVGEAFPFSSNSSYVLGTDSHNSVHGIREFAVRAGASVVYIPSCSEGGFDEKVAKSILQKKRPKKGETSLFALTGQSNITNAKNPLSILRHAKELGYNTLLDAAALAPSSPFSLTEHPVDAMAVSFYKMFGFPTGVGALIAKKGFLTKLKRPWFAGGTVDLVQVPGSVITRAVEFHEQFEDGTINYLLLPAVTDGLRFLIAYLPFLQLRLSSLLHYIKDSISHVQHDVNGAPLVRILSKLPSKRLKSLYETAETGSIISFLFLSPEGEVIANEFIEYAASIHNISLRTGCMCNPGGAATLLGIEEEMGKLYDGVTRSQWSQRMGRELGVVRISLGLGSNFSDAWNFVQFVQKMAIAETRLRLWNQWIAEYGSNMSTGISPSSTREAS